MISPAEQAILQKARIVASQTALLASQLRMQKKAASVSSTGATGAAKGAGLTTAAGGMGAVSSQQGIAIAELEKQKAMQENIANLEAKRDQASGLEKENLNNQLRTQRTALQESKQKVADAKAATRTALPDILKILRLIQF